MTTLLTGCDSDAVDTVKNGVLDLDNTVVIGKALSALPCENQEWEEKETKKGVRFVEFTCTAKEFSVDSKKANSLIDNAIKEVATKVPKNLYNQEFKDYLSKSLNEIIDTAESKLTIQFIMNAKNENSFQLGGIDFRANIGVPLSLVVAFASPVDIMKYLYNVDDSNSPFVPSPNEYPSIIKKSAENLANEYLKKHPTK